MRKIHQPPFTKGPKSHYFQIPDLWEVPLRREISIPRLRDQQQRANIDESPKWGKTELRVGTVAWNRIKIISDIPASP